MSIFLKYVFLLCLYTTENNFGERKEHEMKQRIIPNKPIMRQSQQKSSAFLVCWNVEEASLANSVDRDQTALGPRCLLLYFIRQ